MKKLICALMTIVVMTMFGCGSDVKKGAIAIPKVASHEEQVKEVPLHSQPDPFSKIETSIKDGVKIEVLETKPAPKDIYEMGNSWGYYELTPGYGLKTGNKTMLFKIIKKSNNPFRLSQTGYMVEFNGANGKISAFIKGNEEDLKKNPIEGKFMYKIKTEGGTQGWIYSGFVSLDEDKKVIANKKEEKMETVKPAAPKTYPTVKDMNYSEWPVIGKFNGNRLCVRKITCREINPPIYVLNVSIALVDSNNAPMAGEGRIYSFDYNNGTISCIMPGNRDWTNITNADSKAEAVKIFKLASGSDFPVK